MENKVNIFKTTNINNETLNLKFLRNTKRKVLKYLPR